MERALPFIEYQEDGKIGVNESTRTFLASIKRQVAAIVIVGRYRSGKSYLMNRIFEYEQTSSEGIGFEVDSSLESKTKGIWIRCKLHPHNENICLVFMDTEGFDDTFKKNSKDETMISILAFLLCNTLIYNSKFAIEEDDFRKLEFVTNLTEHIMYKLNESSLPDEEEEDGAPNASGIFGIFHPDLVWILRDVSLKPEMDKKPCSPDQYLEKCLKIKKNPKDANCEEKTKIFNSNLPRKRIKHVFPQQNRKCFFMPFPVLGGRKLDRVSTLPKSEMDPRFEEQLQCLCTQIYNCKPKTMNFDGKSEPLTGKLFAELAVSYTTTLQRTNTICVYSSVEAVTMAKNEEAIEEAFQLYSKGIAATKLPLSADNFESLHEDAKQEAIQLFREKRLFDRDDIYLSELKQKIRHMFLELKAENRSKLELLFTQKVQEWLKWYDENMDETSLPLSKDVLQEMHDKAAEEIRRNFQEIEEFNKDAEFDQRLMEQVRKRYDHWQTKNLYHETKSVNACDKMVEESINEYGKELVQNLEQGTCVEEANARSYQKIWEAFSTSNALATLQRIPEKCQSLIDTMKNGMGERLRHVKIDLTIKQQENKYQKNSIELAALQQQLDEGSVKNDAREKSAEESQKRKSSISTTCSSNDEPETYAWSTNTMQQAPGATITSHGVLDRVNTTSSTQSFACPSSKMSQLTADRQQVYQSNSSNQVDASQFDLQSTVVKSREFSHSTISKPSMQICVGTYRDTKQWGNRNQVQKYSFQKRTAGTKSAYRTKPAIIEREKYFFFYGKDAYLSQDYLAPFTVDGIEFNCATQYVMFHKAVSQGKKKEADKILSAKDPNQQRIIGNNLHDFNAKKWNNENKKVIKNGIKEKFKQNKELLDMLLKTKGKTLAQACTQTKWGIGLEIDAPNLEMEVNWPGQNVYGKLLAEVRKDFQKKGKDNLQ